MSITESGLIRPLRFARFWLLTGLVLLAMILLLALMPGSSLPEVGLSDKLMHAVTFLVLMIWFSGVFLPRHTWLVALGLLVYGGLIELLQGSTPERSMEFADVLADLAGIGLGWLLARAGLQHWCGWLEAGWLWMRDR